MIDVTDGRSHGSTVTPRPPVSTRPLRVVVSLATYRRPAELARILPVLAHQAAELAAERSFVHGCTTEVHVIDNDPDGGARDGSTRWGGRQVSYFHEPEPGIAAARNRSLAEAAHADVIIFVDDDEVPGPRWLVTLVTAWTRWRCAAVAGPVRRRFDSAVVDPWVEQCGEFDRVVRPSGLRIGGGATNNLLLDVAQLRETGLRFDSAFGLSGGDDTMLTHSLIKAGREIRWCNEAEVYDYIPAARSTRSWVLRRARRKGNTWSRVALALTETRSARLRQQVELTARGVHRFGHGLLRWTLGRVTGGVRRQATGAMMMSTGIGVISGVLGIVTSEYLRPTVTPRHAAAPTDGRRPQLSVVERSDRADLVA